MRFIPSYPDRKRKTEGFAACKAECPLKKYSAIINAAPRLVKLFFENGWLGAADRQGSPLWMTGEGYTVSDAMYCTVTV